MVKFVSFGFAVASGLLLLHLVSCLVATWFVSTSLVAFTGVSLLWVVGPSPRG